MHTNTPRHAGRVIAGTALLVAGALVGALWVALGMLPSSAPAAPSTVNVHQAAATGQPTATVTKVVTAKSVAKKTTAKKKAATTNARVRVNALTAQDAQPTDPAPSDTSTDAALPPLNGSGHGGGGPAPTTPWVGNVTSPPSTP